MHDHRMCDYWSSTKPPEPRPEPERYIPCCECKYWGNANDTNNEVRRCCRYPDTGLPKTAEHGCWDGRNRG